MSRKRQAVVVGFDYYAKFLARMMNEHSAGWHLRAFDSSRLGVVRAVMALRKADALICFGGPAPDTAMVESARRRNLPVIVIWAGSDVIKAKADPFDLELVKQERFINLSDGPWLVDELRDLGISAEYLPLTAVTAGGHVKPFPKTFRVLTYLPEPRREFYGAELVYEVAREMPGVPFMVVGAGTSDPHAPPNVDFCGMVNDMQDRLDACTVLLRHPEHDGKSMLVLEALARARHVVWNYTFPGVHTANGFSETLNILKELRALHAASALPLNYQGRTYVLEHFSRPDVAVKFEDRLNRSVAEWTGRNPVSTRRIAISGLSLFCAEVAQCTKSFAPEWEPRILRTSSRVDVLTSVYTLATSDAWYSIGNPVSDRLLHLTARLLRKPRIIHWVGSDIAALTEDPSVRPAVESAYAHLAEVDWTAAQLRSVGLNPRIAPLPPRQLASEVRALPEQFTVMLYVPRSRPDFYGRLAFERLMESLKDKPIKYIVVGGGDCTGPEGVQVENLGWRDNMNEIYSRVSVLLRYTPRDGLSLMVLEALSFGRHVLWTQNFPHTRLIKNYSDMETQILSLYTAHETGTLKPQVDAAEMVFNEYSPEVCMRKIAATWDESLRKGVNGALAMEST